MRVRVTPVAPGGFVRSQRRRLMLRSAKDSPDRCGQNDTGVITEVIDG